MHGLPSRTRCGFAPHRVVPRAAVAALAAALGVSPSAAPVKHAVAHRGASAYAPEHTRQAYQLAIAQGADYVEQDLGVTRDGVLVCLHDPTLERTTNVEEVFPDRARLSGNARRWMVADFTWDELQRLDAGSWFDGKYAGARIPSWQQAVELVRGRAGSYPELKDPDIYRAHGFDVAALLVESLRRNGLDRAGADPKTPVVVQSFDAGTLRALQRALPTVPRVFLIAAGNGAWLTSDRLREIASFATGIGPAKSLIDRRPEVVALAHDAGLTVTPYTFAARSPGRFEDVRAEMRYFLYDLGVDALFTDNPDLFPRQQRNSEFGVRNSESVPNSEFRVRK
jgi:glycerophosphoryl diester phosphodiesterase